MARKCSVCALPNVADLNAELIAGKQSKSGIARKYGVSEDALDRHGENANGQHIPIGLLNAKSAADQALAENVLAQVRQMIPRVLGCLDAAERDKDRKSVTAFMKEFRGFAELVLRAEGKLQSGTSVQVNVANMASPGSAGATPPEFTVEELAQALIALPPEQLTAALERARQIHADEQEAERVALAALPARPQVDAAVVSAPVSAPTTSAPPAPRPEPQSQWLPSRPWRETYD